MANKMLIDASHPEETRVVVVRGNRVEEFDFEAANKKQLRGNIYLAKVIRVEPSLQAAFVDYGGNRHGFLAFSEIHPDYYQIPVADRQALLEEEARHERDADADDENRRNRNRRKPRPAARSANDGDTVSSGAGNGAEGEGAGDFAPSEAAANGSTQSGDEQPHAEVASVEADVQETRAEETGAPEGESDDNGPPESTGENLEEREDVRADQDNDDNSDDDGEHHEEQIIEQVGSEDALEELPERPRPMRRQYKIQEVIKRRQVLLVQVVKEERGNKGAALTTYLSLAGRYSVLMPNTGRGGGISRKITNAVDRKRLKSVAQELEVPEGMGVILRTAGASRTKAEIKRDFEYLMRLWETVRELTLESSAPALTYEEGSLVKRAIRDLYNKDIDEVLVAGEAAYKESKDFMRMLMPSHAKNVKPYREVQPLFARFGVEAQLDAMFSSQVTLKSGGYIVINQTEALVAIDVNSGRATREHNIEDTATKTNCEAADEVARQLRLRDLAGLVVIDFIDMEENRNNRTVERRLKEALKNDRARIQVGRISPFGLMEMSRQRIRTGVLEGSTIPCPHCAGAGIVRATPSVALHVLRAVEEMLIKSNTHNLLVRTRTEVALYILNQKRSHLRGLEDRFGVEITILADESHTAQHAFAIERGEAVLNPRPIPATVHVDSVMPEEEEEIEDVAEDEEDEEEIVEAKPERAPREERGRDRGERQDRPARDDHRGEGRGERRPQEGRGQEGRSQEARPQEGRPQDARNEERRPTAEGDAGEGGRRRRRRRRRRGGRDGRPEGFTPVAGSPMPLDAPQPEVNGAIFGGTATVEPGSDIARELALNEAEGGVVSETENRDRNGRRRGRRGGRRLRGEGDADVAVSNGTQAGSSEAGSSEDGAPEASSEAAVSAAEPAIARAEETTATAAVETEAAVGAAAEEAPAKKPRARKPRKTAAEVRAEAAAAAAAEAGEAPAQEAPASVAAPAPAAPAPVATPAIVAPAPVEPAPVAAAPAPAPEPEVIATEPIVIGNEPTAPRKAGWWAKAKSALAGGE